MASQKRFQLLSKSVLQKVQEPPKSFEEFLKSQKWDYWPKAIRFRDSDIWEEALKKLEENSSYASIYSYLWTNVPRVFETVSTMESRLKECSHLLQQHSSNLLECNRMILKKSSYTNLERYKAFLKEHCRQRKIMLSDEMETEKNIEGCSFLGFRQNKLTQLPRHLDAEQIYLFVLRNNNLEEKMLKFWKTHILSDCSIALLHDCFWWWFLHKFKPDQKDEDCLFDRISESYVTLFLQLPHKKKDAFLQVYPDFLAQAIYAAFQESFPESSDLFNNEFKEDLGNTIFLWLSGLKPPRGFWTRWRLKELCTTTIHGSKRALVKSVQKRILSSQEHITSTMDFNMSNVLKNPRVQTTSMHKEESSVSRAPTKPSTPPAPTYCEIIQEAKRKFAKNRKDFRRAKQRIREEIRLLKEQEEAIDKELDRLQAKASKNIQEVTIDFENFLHKRRVEAKLEEYKGSSITPSSGSPQLPQSPQSSSSTTTSEAFSYAEEG